MPEYERCRDPQCGYGFGRHAHVVGFTGKLSYSYELSDGKWLIRGPGNNRKICKCFLEPDAIKIVELLNRVSEDRR